MLNFLFWNINKNSVGQLLSEMAREHSIDIIVLAESEIKPAKLLSTLNSINTPNFQFAWKNSRRLYMYTRFPSTFVRPIHHGRYASYNRVTLPGRLEFILVSVHMPSKLYLDKADQQYQYFALSEKIKEVEIKENNKNTIIVGDLNINPFEDGAVSAAGLNSVMTKNIALKDERIIGGKKYPFFYNPMWSAFGDITQGPAGSYYYNKSGQINYYWNVFDQVLIRPNLIQYFKEEELQILESANSTSLINAKGLPNSLISSDHLPLKFGFSI